MPAPTLSARPTVLASWFCPFAQRTLIALHAKKPAAEFDHCEISHDELYNKPQWFLDLNPAGLIPVIAWQEEAGGGGGLPHAVAAAAPGVVAIRESLVCNEFVNEAFPDPPLLPAEPAGRAAARLIINRFDLRFVPSFYRLLVQQDTDVQAAAAGVLQTELAWLLQQLAPIGPLALGQQLSLVDCAVAPFLIRLNILQHYRGFTYQGPEPGRLQAYLSAVQQQPAVAATCYHPDGAEHYQEALLQSYARYADGSANSLMARDAKANK